MGFSMSSEVLKVMFVKQSYRSYQVNEEAAFPLRTAVWLVGRGIARFSDPADLETHAAEVAKAANCSHE